MDLIYAASAADQATLNGNTVNAYARTEELQSRIAKLDLVSPFIYTGQGASTSTTGVYNQFGLQGIKGSDSTGSFLITGTSGSNGVVYNGPIDHAATPLGTGSGTWTVMNVPAGYLSSSTSIYGVANLSGENVRLVGSYVSQTRDASGGNPRIGFTYYGPVTATPNPQAFTSFQARDPQTSRAATFTYLHSTDGELVVGNYDFLGDGNPAGNAFVLDPLTGVQTAIIYPDTDKTHTAYGIWHDGGDSYTISGGVGITSGGGDSRIGEPLGQGALINYDKRSGRFTDYRAYSFTETELLPSTMQRAALVTHFEGIWSDGRGRYLLPATVSTTDRNLSVGAIAEVRRQANGSFGSALWTVFQIPGSSISTNDSIFANANVGVAVYSGAAGASNYAGLLI